MTTTATTDDSAFAPEFRPFWTNLEDGRIAFPRCGACGRHHWYPMQRCPHCLSTTIGWEPVRGDAELYSWTVVRHAFTPEYRDKVPYVVALVEFPDAPGVRLVTNLLGPDTEWRCGMNLRAVIRPAEAGGNPTVVFEAA